MAGNLISAAAHFAEIFHVKTDSSCARKTKGNEPWMLQPKTTQSLHTPSVEQRERESKSKLFKMAWEYVQNTSEENLLFCDGNLGLGGL